MKTACVVFLVLAIALVGAPSPASAASLPPSYMVLKGGLYSPSDDFDFDTIHFERDDGFVAEIAFGHYFLPFLATELGVGYFESKASPAVPAGEVKFKVVPVTLTAKVPLPIGPIEPYGEFGIGAYITEFDVSGTPSNFDGGTEAAFGLHAGGGVNLNISPAFFSGAEGRYIWVKPSFGGEDIQLDGFTVTGNLGFRF